MRYRIEGVWLRTGAPGVVPAHQLRVVATGIPDTDNRGAPPASAGDGRR